MFELADEIGREHVRLLRALVRTKSAWEMTNGAEDAERVYCAVGDVKEKKLTDGQRQAIVEWAHGYSIPYVQGKDALGKLEAIGFLTSQKHQMVYEGDRMFAWTYKVEVTVRARDFMSRRLLSYALSFLSSKANRWVLLFLALVTLVGSGWSWVSNLAAMVD